jgi:hypothetical protein
MCVWVVKVLGLGSKVLVCKVVRNVDIIIYIII